MTRKSHPRDDWPDRMPASPLDGVEQVRLEMDRLDEVVELEMESFETPWTRGAFEFDLTQNDLAHYWALICDGEIIGYSGIWLVGRVAHLTTICIRKRHRGIGLGRWLLLETMHAGAELGAERFTLEVRESNREAIELYESVGYRMIGRKPDYYHEIGEDAIVMWTGQGSREK